MLTDRQEKIKQEINDLLSTSNSMSLAEEIAVQEAQSLLENKEVDFKYVINKLMISFDACERYEGRLSDKTNDLFMKLVSTYGKPKYDLKEVNWKISDPDYVFVERGGFSQGEWVRRNPNDFEDSKKFWGYLNLVLFFSVVIGFWWTPVPAFLEEKFGDAGNYISLVLMCFIIILWVGYFGSFKRDKKKNHIKGK